MIKILPTIKKLVLDHDHKTDKIRGILCRNCNLALGLMKDNINSIKRMIDYLKL